MPDERTACFAQTFPQCPVELRRHQAVHSDASSSQAADTVNISGLDIFAPAGLAAPTMVGSGTA
jgi:hypothetical protein